MRNWKLLILPIVALAIALGVWLWWTRPVPVDMTTAHRGQALDIVYATGYVEVEEPVEVSAQITAPITQVLAAEGARVSRGQALATLYAADQQALVRQLAAQRVNADIEAARTRKLFKDGWTTAAARDKADATARAARAAEGAAQAKLENYVLRAGVAGVVLRRDVEPGDLASPGKTLFVIGDPAQLKVTATVDERDMPRIRTGQAALMSSDAYPNRILKGHVRDITPSGDPTQRAFRARLVLDQPEPLPVGLTLEVNIVTRTVDNALLVPASAISDDHVWVVSDGRARKRAVTTGISGIDHVQVTDGLKPDEKIIAQPPEGLEDGARVKAGKATAPRDTDPGMSAR